jgi:hypothetical protein
MKYLQLKNNLGIQLIKFDNKIKTRIYLYKIEKDFHSIHKIHF